MCFRMADDNVLRTFQVGNGNAFCEHEAGYSQSNAMHPSREAARLCKSVSISHIWDTLQTCVSDLAHLHMTFAFAS